MSNMSCKLDGVIIRPAVLDDVPAILNIFNEVVLKGTAVYCYLPESLETKVNWFNDRVNAGYPVFTAVLSGNVIGYASYGKFHDRPAYKYSVEHSVFVDKDFRGQGVAKLLLQELIRDAVKKQYHTIIGCIDAENEASIKLHEKFGFEIVGNLKQVGYKFDRWLDMKMLQLVLNTPEDPISS